MRKKEGWKTQADVDAIANRLLKEAGGDLDRVHGNAVATALGMPKGNQSIYAKVDDWKKRMETQGIHHVRQAPIGLREELEERLSTGVEDIVRIALGLTGKTIDRERQRSDQTETVLGEKIALLESELDREREARVLADSKVETMSKELAALRDEAAADKRRADIAEAKLDEVRGHHEALLDRLNVVPARSERVQEALEAKEVDEGYPIDMSRYDYEE
tara:strand:+ start:1861 stop:2514 length:654 start_codon:yes stop_codon:yes gene_type:complete